ncbi:MAG: ATP-dependent helicase [Candidatus Njordarchaeales archaeon]
MMKKDREEDTIITVNEKPPADRDIFSMLQPYVAEWFRKTFKTFTLPQRYAIPRIKNRRNVLVFSPTGSGKTLAAFLAIINDLFKLGEKGELEDKVYCVYVSPLRALSNDIRRNLQVPLAGIKMVADELGVELPDIRAFVRTGDTPQSQRNKMLKKPPHILITTPESLAIVLNAPKFRKHLSNVRWVIVDEVHELSSNKRGAHLSLSLERLQYWVDEEFTRIGLSATQAPVKEIAKWLVGFRDDGKPRQCDIIKVPAIKQLDLRVICPVKDLRNREAASRKMYEILKNYIRRYRTTLIFTNTRSGAENVAHKLAEILGESFTRLLGTHHSSLGRDIRLEVEEKLKRGELKAVVTSTSLELGIDIGYIDLVVQIGSPKSVAKGLQRIGRAGHALHKVSRGRFIAMDEDDLVECTVLVKYAYEGKIDRVRIPKNPLDVLAQHLVGMSLEKKWSVDEAYKLIKRSYNFHSLDWADFIAVLKYLAGYHVDLEYRQVYRKLWYDEEEGVFGRKKGSRMIYFLNLGTIPEEADYDVILVTKEKRRKFIGRLSEPFVERLVPGDVFVLGGRKYKVIKIRGNNVFVSEAKEEKPTVPSWIGEMLPRSWDLSLGVGEFREILEKVLKEEGREAAKKWLRENFKLGRYCAENIVRYFKDQLEFLGIIPSHRKIVLEEFIDDLGRYTIIFHAPYGRRVNDALSRACAYIASKLVRSNVGIGITDDGFALVLPRGIRLEPRKIIDELLQADLRSVLKEAIKGTELFVNRFRHCAVRSFMILRAYKGKVISVEKRKIKAQTLLKYLGEDFPVIKETFREILEDYMDVEHAEQVLKWIREGKIRVLQAKKRDLTLASPFAHNLILSAEADILTMKDREAWILAMYERLKKSKEEKAS